MSVKKPKLVCVTGIDGSGKSTLIAELKKEFPKARVVTIWDMMRNPDFSKVSLFRESKDVDTYLSLLKPPARTFFLFHCMSEAIQSALKENHDLILIDAYWYKYGASEIASGGSPSLILNMGEAFPKPDFIFFLDLDSSDALARKGQYSGYECGYHPERAAEGFVNFQGASYQKLKELMNAIGAFRLDGRKSIPENRSAALAELSKNGINP